MEYVIVATCRAIHTNGAEISIPQNVTIESASGASSPNTLYFQKKLDNINTTANKITPLKNWNHLIH